MTMRPSFGWGNWTVLIAYLVAMILLGYYFMKREGDADDFFKGGGRIPWWAAGISIYATMLSAITYMAYPAKLMPPTGPTIPCSSPSYWCRSLSSNIICHSSAA